MVIKSETTRRYYERALRRLREGLNAEEGIGFLGNAGRVIAWIEGQGLSENSKKAYYIAIKATLRDEGKFPEAAKEYDRVFEKHADKVVEAAKKQTLTESEKKKYLPWGEVLKVRERMAERMDGGNFQEVQDWVILCLYTMMPPLRADFADMRVYDRAPSSDVGNYLVLTDKSGTFVLHDYKTQSTFGRVEFKAPAELLRVLKEWKEYNPTEWLLVKKEGEPMDAHTLGQRVISIFARESGKPVGISMLRHAYITERRKGKELSLVEKEKLARSMLHSSLTNEYYKRMDG